jgi:FkbH-like protein
MPELLVVKVTEEAKERTVTTRALLERQQQRETIADPNEYRRSLGLCCSVQRLGPEDDLERAHELILRTNQFNTTGWRVPKHELRAILREDDSARLHVMRVEDRFTDYGLVGACLVRGGSIDLFVMSCRVIGLGVEHALLRSSIVSSGAPVIRARIVSTDRNFPVRNLFRDHGFTASGEVWTIDCATIEALPPLDATLSLVH